MAKDQRKLARHVAIVRIIFGLIWAIDAGFKWTPTFQNNFSDLIPSSDGQPSWLHGWFSFWSHLLTTQPHFFAIMIAVIETLIALALLFGFLRQITYLSAALFSLMIWSVAEGFGGPYTSASTDVGAGIIYTIVFFSLYGLERMASPSVWSLDSYIAKHVPWWAIIADPLPTSR